MQLYFSSNYILNVSYISTNNIFSGVKILFWYVYCKKMFHKIPFFVPHQKQVHNSATQISVQGLYWLYLMDIDKVGF